MHLPFLTELDDREKTKGSRDPLGIQIFWTGLGREVIGNLTTVSNSAREFTVLLLGFWLIERHSERRGPGAEIDFFLKWEQMAAYARARHQPRSAWAFRGVDRVAASDCRLRRVTLSAARQNQILSNQKTYGLWGLYTSPGQASGLLAGAPLRLTSSARSEMAKLLRASQLQEGDSLVDLLSPEAVSLDLSRDTDKSRLAEKVARMLPCEIRPTERDFYSRHLFLGEATPGTQGRQAVLADLIATHLRSGHDIDWSPALLRAWAKQARRRNETGASLARRLENIAAAEEVFAPSAAIFGYLLGCHGRTLAEVAQMIRVAWPPSGRVSPEVFADAIRGRGRGIAEEAERWNDIARHLSSGDQASFVRLLRLLIGQNAAVMRHRGGAGPWIIAENERVTVLASEEGSDLPPPEWRENPWRHGYFLPSLLAVARQLAVPATPPAP